jgi:hypothetical protein
MKSKFLLPALAGIAVVSVGITAVIAQTASKTSFFLSSKGLGKGADLGGIEGADKHCADLAKAAGLTRTEWRAYLSTTPTKQGDKDVPGVNARDRIGKGPWYNAKGQMIARGVNDLHSDKVKIDAKTALTEKGEAIPGRADVAAGKPNQHDVLTGSDPMGLYSTAGGDTTCGNWTKSAEGSAIVGHHDRAGLNMFRHALSWNSSHGSRGCSQDNLKASGGAGLVYCFAAK